MIRVVLFLIVVGALSLAVAWLTDRPGDVVITWQGMRIETSLMVLGAAVLAAMALLALIVALIRAVLRSPAMLANRVRNRRGMRAYEAISNGLIAVGAGDIAAARKHLRRGQPHRGRRTAGAVARRAIGTAFRRPRNRRARFPHHGEPRRHQDARPARPLH